MEEEFLDVSQVPVYVRHEIVHNRSVVDQVALINVESGDSQRFSYGDDWLVEEHLLVRADGETRSRWIVGTSLDLAERQTVVSIFNAEALDDGPVAQARLPYALPLGLHGTYRPLPVSP